MLKIKVCEKIKRTERRIREKKRKILASLVGAVSLGAIIIGASIGVVENQVNSKNNNKKIHKIHIHNVKRNGSKLSKKD